jgi:hypothetical protein
MTPLNNPAELVGRRVRLFRQKQDIGVWLIRQAPFGFAAARSYHGGYEVKDLDLCGALEYELEALK